MKNDAQSLLQFIGYPLEPIVALHVKQRYQSHIQAAFGTAVMAPPAQPANATSGAKNRFFAYK
jgi:hypothetical protein